MHADLLIPWDAAYEDYLHDESRAGGHVETISFPHSEEDVIAIVRAVQAIGGALTVQGARTGITAAAVPHGGHLLSLERMNTIGAIARDAVTGQATLSVQPGAHLEDIRRVVAEAGWYFPPDPTETSASIGGMVACNASGAQTFYYGPTRRWIQALRVVLSDGSTLTLRRGGQRAQGRAFSLVTDAGRVIAGVLPDYTLPVVKNAAGYYAADDMELIDLFIGMEGTLGIITHIELRLIPPPAAVLGVLAFLPSEEAALACVNRLRTEAGRGEYGTARLVALEYFDHDALSLFHRMKTEEAAFEGVPALPATFHSALYVEFHGEDDETLFALLEPFLVMIEDLEGDGDACWCATTPQELLPLKAFRHAIPEAVNLLIAQRRRALPAITKLGTDMSVPDAELPAVMALYRQSLAESGLASVIFGHIGNNHLHVNILPNSLEDYARGKDMYLTWARHILAYGGSIAAEHGIGKLKRPFLELMYGAHGIAQMRAVKALFDPAGMLNPGNLFDSSEV